MSLLLLLMVQLTSSSLQGVVVKIQLYDRQKKATLPTFTAREKMTQFPEEIM